ncbi:LacI family DNA-binding transcriptional regulator [Neobacillus sp. NPDC093127]|uniref:LacI family DNA-binding transcriptional regulator n=1 Tax=Neobacillus sp. NPDC093127 TaxID=3364296 RepID=UPI00380C7739
MSADFSIKDIAKASGVSVSTVSRVLNGKDRVSENTRKQVLKVIEELNYVPSNVAVSMVKKETKMIAVIVPDIINPFYTAVIKGTEEYARSQGYFTLVFSTNDNKEEEEEFFKGFLSKIVDGIIIVPASTDIDFYANFKKPIVLVDRYIEGSKYDGVVIDNFDGAYQATKHFIEKGHKDIAIISGPTEFNIGKDRFWGYERALKENHLNMNPNYIKKGDWFEDNGYHSTLQLLDLENPPTAIFASNNLTCVGCIKALNDRKVEVGKEISLIGFDDNELANFVSPKITIIRRPTSEMGSTATRLLLERKGMEKAEITHRKIMLGTELVIRGSVERRAFTEEH